MHQGIPDVHQVNTCRGEDAPNDATEPDQELPQWHVLLGNRHHERADVILHEDPRDTVASCCVVDHTVLEG